MKILKNVGYAIGYVIARVILLKAGWWLFGFEEWCGLGLPWDIALFFAVFTLRPTKHTANLLMVRPTEPGPTVH